MFGYVKPHADELLVKEYSLYRALYCGTCRAMRAHTGRLSSLTLSYDIVFLAAFRTVLLRERIDVHAKRCLVHPLKRRPMVEETPTLAYCAAVSAILAYEKCRDDLRDLSFFASLPRRLALFPLWRAKQKAHMPALASAVAKELSRLHGLEDAKCPHPDEAADVFGELLGTVFAYGIAEAQAPLCFAVGRSLGRFIYLADAWEDHKKDEKAGNYNPYLLLYGASPPPEALPELRTALTVELSRLAEGLEQLDYAGHAELESILKNTVYLGLPKRISAWEEAHE